VNSKYAVVKTSAKPTAKPVSTKPTAKIVPVSAKPQASLIPPRVNTKREPLSHDERSVISALAAYRAHVNKTFQSSRTADEQKETFDRFDLAVKAFAKQFPLLVKRNPKLVRALDSRKVVPTATKPASKPAVAAKPTTAKPTTKRKAA